MKHVALTQNARDDRVYLRKRVSTGYSGLSFHPRGTCALGCRYICVRTTCMYNTSGACMPRVVDFSKRCVARTFLSAWAYCACMWCPAVRTERRSIVICLDHHPGSRLHACVCAQCGRVATRYRAHRLSRVQRCLSRTHINTCSPRAFATGMQGGCSPARSFMLGPR